MITKEIRDSIDSSVLCWLATVSEDGTPNVSPKEAFLYDAGKIVVAHIASPKTVKNISKNPKVCISFINVFTQKGFKVTGFARVINKDDRTFDEKAKSLKQLVGESHKILGVIIIDPLEVESIIAPSYKIHPDITELDMIKQSYQTYQIESYRTRIEQVDGSNE